MNKVLIFESDPALAGYFRTELGARGCHVSTVEDGNLGMRLIEEDAPDLILLSVELPRMNGFSICNRLKKDDATKGIPIVMWSSESTDETFDNHRVHPGTRAQEYLHKKMGREAMLAKVLRFIGEAPPAEGAPADEVDIDVDAGDDEMDDRPTPSQGSVDAGLEDDARQSLAASGEADLEQLLGNLDRMILPDTPPGESHPPEVVTRATVSSPPPPLRQSRPPETAETKSKIEALEREVAALRSAPKAAAGGSSREFLDLREALNKKDKELLELRDLLSQKDKDALALRDQLLVVERQKADEADRVAQLEGEAAALQSKLHGLQQEQKRMLQAQEEVAARIEAAEAEWRSSVAQVATLEKRAADQARALQNEKVALEAAHQEAMKALEQRAADAVKQAELAVEARLSEATREAVRQAESRAERAIEEIRSEGERQRADAMAKLRFEAEAELSGLTRAHEAETKALENAHAKAIQEAASRANDALARREAEIHSARDDSERALRSEHATQLAAMTATIEQHRQDRERSEREKAELESVLARNKAEREADESMWAQKLQHDALRAEALAAAVETARAKEVELQAALSKAREAIDKMKTLVRALSEIDPSS